jgi:hypothetical protein
MQSVYVQQIVLNPWAPENRTCFEPLISELSSIFEHMSLPELLGNRTRGIQKTLEDGRLSKTRISWGKFTTVGPSTGVSQKSILKLDGVGSCSCGKHIISIVLCLNNREAIGTNLLKVELANNFFSINSATQETTGVMICLSRETLNLGGWDKAYADASEYAESFRGAYFQLVKNPLVVLEVHSP